MIEKNNLNLVKYGDGEAIFDGQSAGEMLYLVTNSEPKSINIKGLTFKNAMMYAIAFYGDYGVSDSSINATFINIGTGQWGSAIFAKSADNVDITGTFINNAAGEGLIQMPNSKNIRIHDSIFINNGETTLFKINESSLTKTSLTPNLLNSIFKFLIKSLQFINFTSHLFYHFSYQNSNK